MVIVDCLLGYSCWLLIEVWSSLTDCSLFCFKSWLSSVVFRVLPMSAVLIFFCWCPPLFIFKAKSTVSCLFCCSYHERHKGVNDWWFDGTFFFSEKNCLLSQEFTLRGDSFFLFSYKYSFFSTRARGSDLLHSICSNVFLWKCVLMKLFSIQ
jgi:hypothetical protein